MSEPLPKETPPADNWRAVAGGLLLGFSALPFAVPALTRWPWHLVVPLLAFFAVVSVVSPLRRTLVWARIGRLDVQTLGLGALIAVLSSTVLVLFDTFAQPDLRSLAEHLPVSPALPLVVSATLFAVSNALLEEVYFRGILLDAFESQLGVKTALSVQAVAFGLGHAKGYPPGEVGVIFASVYGLLLGLLRVAAGGLGVSFLTHIFADVTIFILVVRAS